MAGVPRAAVVAVALPRRTAVEVAQGLHAGMHILTQRFGVDLVGGDTNAWDGPLVISLTLLGEATARGAVRRAGAKPGDVILVTGPLGGVCLPAATCVPSRAYEALPAQSRGDPCHDRPPTTVLRPGHLLAESGQLGRPDAAAIPIHPDASELSSAMVSRLGPC
jgi:thiamine-monophosphate kinase